MSIIRSDYRFDKWYVISFGGFWEGQDLLHFQVDAKDW